MRELCRWCGNYHETLCPRVRSLEFFKDGQTVKKVEFHPPATSVPASPLVFPAR